MENSKLTEEFVSKLLFEGDSNSTFEITKKFEEKLQGYKIEWTGVIDNITEFTYDSVFKNSKGVKVIFNTYELSSVFGNPKVYAIVHFPTELFNELKKKKGEKLTFTGKMTKVDSLMRKFYISDGEIVTPEDSGEKVNAEKTTKEVEKEKITRPDDLEEKNPTNIDKQEKREVREEIKQSKKRRIPKSKSNNIGAMGITRAELQQLQQRKKILIFVIVGSFVAVVCIIIILGMKLLIQGSGTKKHKKVNKFTGVHVGSRKINTSKRGLIIKSSPQISRKFYMVSRKVQSMPQTNKKEIDAIIKLWQSFVDKNGSKHPNDHKIHQAKELIKTLKELQTMY